MTQTAQQLTWNDVLKRDDLIGGDIESQEFLVVYRGPLAEIKEDGDHIYFVSPWFAEMNRRGEWENCHSNTPISVNKCIPPYDIGDGRVYFSIPLLGEFTIFPKNGSKLDEQKIKGLPKASERLIALYPDLRFDREIAGKVLTEKSWPHQAEALSKLPSDATLANLLATFRHDISAEEFLWHYIEAVTGENEVHQKVY